MTFIYENIENNSSNIKNNDENEQILGYVPKLVPPFRGKKYIYIYAFIFI